MFITVVHSVSDPEKFWSTAQNIIESGGIPEGITLHGSYPSPSGTRAVCLWEASSVEAVKSLIEDSVGSFSENEYFEVAASNAIGLPG